MRFIRPALFWLALMLAYFAPALAQGLVLAPGDVMAQDLPQRAIVAASLRQGELPFWNPYNFSGMPLMATIHAGVFFPGNAAFLLLPPAIALNVTLVLAFWVAGGATYMFARALDLPRLAAAFSGIGFALGGFMIAHVSNLQMVQVAGLLPLLLWAAERYARTLAPRFALAGCATVALMLLGGHPQVMAYSLLMAGAYVLWRCFGLAKGDRLRYVGTLCLMVGLGIGLCLFQLLPTLDLIRMTPRETATYASLTSHSVPPRYLPTLLAPFLYGGATSGFLQTPYWGVGGIWMQGYYGYVGLVTLLLGLIALGRWRLDGQVRFWGLAAGLTLLLALGGHTPLYRLWALLPVLNTMPAPDRHLLEFTLAAALLGGFGVARLQREAPAHWRRAAIMALAAVGALVLSLPLVVLVAGPGFVARTQPLMPAGIDLARALQPTQPNFWLPALWWLIVAALLLSWRPGTRRWLTTGLLACQLADLAVFGYHHGWWQFSPRMDQAIVEPGLRFSHDRSLSLPAKPYPFLGDMGRLRALGQPGVSFLDGVRSVNGYDAFIYRRYAHYTGMTSLGYLGAAHVWSPGHHALNVLGLKTLRLDPAIAGTDGWRALLKDDRFAALPAPLGVLAFENRQALPRAWRPAIVSVLTPDQVDARMTDDITFDPRREALIEGTSQVPASAGTASAQTLSLNRIRLETEGALAGLVVVNEGYDPGWRAFSGDKELGVQRVDGLVLGIVVPPGHHSITLRYEPRLWRVGLLGSGLALAGLLIWAMRNRRRATPQGKPLASRQLEHDHAASC